MTEPRKRASDADKSTRTSPRRQAGTTQRPAEPGDLLALDQAVEMLRTTRPTFYRWIRGGKVRGMKVGRQWRFERREIERFLKGEGAQAELRAAVAPLVDQLKARYRELVGREFDGTGSVDPAVGVLLHVAVRMRASDIHVEPEVIGGSRQLPWPPGQATIRLRIDGSLQPLIRFDLQLLPAFIALWKGPAHCDVREKSRPQDGRIQVQVGADDMPEQALDVRVCFLPTVLGEAMAARLLRPQECTFALDRIDFAPADRTRLEEALGSPCGLIVLAGPTGSGKTTVLYSCLNRLVAPGIKVVSVEDPVEYLLPGVSQVQVSPAAGLTFASAIRAAFRSDPDVILVGEIRDRETLNVCIQAALTGHLVLTSLHASGAARALRRMVDIGTEAYLVADTVRLVLAQRLVRVLCPHCSRPEQPSGQALEMARKWASEGGLDWEALPKEFRRPVGCEKCRRTGYLGRTVIAETLRIDDDLAKGILRGEPAESLAVAGGMTTMAADGVRRAAAGRTTLQELRGVLALT